MSLNEFFELLDATQRSAVHLEMRDAYAVGDESGDFATWRRTGERDVDPESDYWRPWVDHIKQTVARGVVMRRARIVSEPVSSYIRFEHAGTPVNLVSGELVRWLPRSRASDIALPGNDFWLFDEATVQFNHFDGDGDWSRTELVTEPAVAKLCATAFEAVWERAVPHESYRI